MNDRKKMDIKLEIIEQLYDGSGELAEHFRVERPDVSNEFDSMRAMKSALDARPSQRPDAAAFDAVLRAAANASAGREPGSPLPVGRQDRPPRARRALYLRSAGVATAVLTVLIAVTTVWQTNLLDESLPLTPQNIAPGVVQDESSSMLDRRERTHQDLAEEKHSGSASRPAKAGSSAPAAGNSAGKPTDSGERFAAAAGSSEDFAADRGAEEIAAEAEFSAGDRVPGFAAMDEPFARVINATQMASSRGESPAAKAAGRQGARRPSDILPVDMRPMNITDYAREHGFSFKSTDQDLTWDQAADVMEMYQLIEMIGTGVSHGWEPPSVPLEMVPTSRQNRGSSIQPAGERRTP